MEDEEERYQEYKDKCDDKDDLTKDLALAQKNLGYRDRLYSTSGVIIEGPVLKQKKKITGQSKSKLDEWKWTIRTRHQISFQEQDIEPKSNTLKVYNIIANNAYTSFI